MSNPEISVLVSSFQQPEHLRLVLESLAWQRGVQGKIEVVVTDDGSRDETIPMLISLARRFPHRLTYTTHRHEGFQLARCRNEGVAASTAPYLLFLDGDCLAPPDHLQQHLLRRRPGWVMAGYCARLDQESSQKITLQAVREGTFVAAARWRERWPLIRMDYSSRYYNLIGHRSKPKLFGGNIGISRADYLRVNGYDESFRGWGCEDDDLRIRLRRAGLRIASILRWTRTYHLWHPRVPSAPTTWREGSNVEYLRRRCRLTRCANGLQKRGLDDVNIGVLGGETHAAVARRILPLWMKRRRAQSRTPHEIEILFAPSKARFSGRADCQIAVVLDKTGPALSQAAGADIILCDRSLDALAAKPTFRTHDLERALTRLVYRIDNTNAAIPGTCRVEKAA